MYDSDQANMFVVHQQSEGKPNMEFHMHPSGLHYWDPRKEGLAFINTVAVNMEGFTKEKSSGPRKCAHSIQHWDTHPGLITNGSFVATSSKTAL